MRILDLGEEETVFLAVGAKLIGEEQVQKITDYVVKLLEEPGSTKEDTIASLKATSLTDLAVAVAESSGSKIVREVE